MAAQTGAAAGVLAVIRSTGMFMHMLRTDRPVRLTAGVEVLRQELQCASLRSDYSLTLR